MHDGLRADQGLILCSEGDFERKLDMFEGASQRVQSCTQRRTDLALAARPNAEGLRARTLLERIASSAVPGGHASCDTCVAKIDTLGPVEWKAMSWSDLTRCQLVSSPVMRVRQA